MTRQLTRRSFLAGLITAPAIVHAANIMKVRALDAEHYEFSIDLLRRVMETMKEHMIAGIDIDRITGVHFHDGRVQPAILDEGRRMFKAANPMVTAATGHYVHYVCQVIPANTAGFLL